MKKADLHIHSNFSDGSDSIEELVGKINALKLDVFALTDHDTFEGVIELEKYKLNGIKFIKGIELTCKTKDVKCHILGYGIDTTNKNLKNLIEKGKILRKQKLDLRIEYLKNVHNIVLNKNELSWLYSRKSVVKTHLANVLVKRGLADNNLSAMEKYLDGCKTGNTRFDGFEAIDVLLDADAIPVWAHPLGGEGEKHSKKEEFLLKLDTMIKAGIKGLECYYSRYNDFEIEFLVDCAKKNNLLISGGSDYHGLNKNIPLLKLNELNIPVDAKFLTVLNNL
ncbi:TPA: PHP domain-containing protein [Candidatus Galligastranaerophilus gallistercoris]|nr:PHP domain-containing protein [Candidatus Galligastranaerophilus gallistercoris]